MRAIMFPNAHTVRLAGTYLAIIMVMSIGFSVVVYRSSVSQIRIQNPLRTNSTSQDVLFTSTGNSTSSKTKILTNGHVTQADIANLNHQIQQTQAKIRSNELRRLIMLNIAVLILGVGFSYFLARRTLRPIENAIEEQSRFASDASHELRTPLAAMQAENEEALLTSKLPDKAKRLIASNLEEITRLRELSEGLLHLSSDSNSLALQPVWADDVSTEAMNIVIKSAQAKHIAIEDLWLHTQVVADKQSLVQVVVILLDNAIKYSKEKTIIYLESTQNDKYAYLSVRDEGIGIDSEQIPKVFNRFYRADQSRTKQHVEGHGLGLSIARKLMQKQRGEITATSTVSEGSTFTIKLHLLK